MFPPIFPVSILALRPLAPYATLIWLAGVVCLWLTRYTHQFGRRWPSRPPVRGLRPCGANGVGRAAPVRTGVPRPGGANSRMGGVPYYAFSALVRPAGVLLIGIGWLALYAPLEPAQFWSWGVRVPWLGRGSGVELLCVVAIAAFFGLGVWSVHRLGLRRTFLYRHADDALVTSGPYAIVRHPQFLSAIGITLFGAILYDPQAWPWVGPTTPVHANWVLLTAALWALSIVEDRELSAHFGAEYELYARCVPRLFPN